jgi:hypothetical protein
MMNVESEWTVYRTRFLVRARQLTEPLCFTDALGREHRGQPGDYLVESSDGYRRVAPRTIFEDVYVPMERRASCRDAISGRTTRSVSATLSGPADPGPRLGAWTG